MLRSVMMLVAVAASTVLFAASTLYAVLVVGCRREVHHHYGS